MKRDRDVDTDINFWLDDKNFKSNHIVEKTKSVLRFFIIKLNIVLDIFRTKWDILKFIFVTQIVGYFALIFHECIHSITAICLGGISFEIVLNSSKYFPLKLVIECVSFNHIKVSSIDWGSDIPSVGGYTSLIVFDPVSDVIVTLMPAIVLFSIGFIWIKKGVNEKSVSWFGAGFALITMHWRMFVTHLHSDATIVARILQIYVPLNINFEILTFIVAFGTLFTGYMIFKIYDVGMRKLIKLHCSKSNITNIDKVCILLNK